MKKIVTIFLVCAMMMCQAINVFANDDLEQYEMVECELETVPMQNPFVERRLKHLLLSTFYKNGMEVNG